MLTTTKGPRRVLDYAARRRFFAEDRRSLLPLIGAVATGQEFTTGTRAGRFLRSGVAR
jgi:hypothetical protein